MCIVQFNPSHSLSAYFPKTGH